MLHRAVISIGSNTADQESKLRQALALLDVTILQATEPYIDPNDNNPACPYLNIIALIETLNDYPTLNNRFKELEHRLGRDRQSDTVAIDIDIVIFDDAILRPADFARPYFQSGYKLIKKT